MLPIYSYHNIDIHLHSFHMLQCTHSTIIIIQNMCYSNYTIGNIKSVPLGTVYSYCLN